MISTLLQHAFNILFSYNEAMEAKPHELGTPGWKQSFVVSPTSTHCDFPEFIIILSLITLETIIYANLFTNSICTKDHFLRIVCCS